MSQYVLSRLLDPEVSRNSNGLLMNGNFAGQQEQTRFLADLLYRIRPAKILETGTLSGMFCYFALELLKTPAIFTFDLDPHAQKAVDILNEHYGNRIKLTLGDSKQTLRALNEPGIKFAWVDGGHDQKTCFYDLRNCSRLGIPHICVDDYKMCPGVKPAVDEFCGLGAYAMAGADDFKKDNRGIVYLRLAKKNKMKGRKHGARAT